MTLFTIVAMSLAGVAVYWAYKNPKLGASLLVGAGILAAVYLIGQQDASQAPLQAPAPAASSSVPAVAGPPPSPSVSSSGQAPSARPEV
ncbi:hypothetical protein ACFV9G_29900, partial [Nocardioides sp. NPDC059952]